MYVWIQCTSDIEIGGHGVFKLVGGAGDNAPKVNSQRGRFELLSDEIIC